MIEKRKIEIDVLPTDEMAKLKGGNVPPGCKYTVNCGCYKDVVTKKAAV